MSNLREFHRDALRATEEIVSGIDGGLERPTPCGEWTLRELLAHLIGQNHGFADAVRCGTDDLASFAPRDGVAGQAFTDSVADVQAAFAEHGALERTVMLPEIRPGQPFPARVALGFHFVDTVVHAWDLAKSVGVPVDFAEDLLEAALAIATQVPGGESRDQPGAAFARALDVPANAAALDQVVALLGRSPTWPS